MKTFKGKILYKYLFPLVLITSLSLLISILFLFFLVNQNFGQAENTVTKDSNQKVVVKIAEQNKNLLSALSSQIKNTIQNKNDIISFAQKIRSDSPRDNAYIHNKLFANNKDILQVQFYNQKGQLLNKLNKNSNTSIQFSFQANKEAIRQLNKKEEFISSLQFENGKSFFAVGKNIHLEPKDTLHYIGIIDASFVNNLLREKSKENNISIFNYAEKGLDEQLIIDSLKYLSANFLFPQEKDLFVKASVENAPVELIAAIPRKDVTDLVSQNSNLLGGVFTDSYDKNLIILICLLIGAILLASYAAYRTAKSVTTPIVKLKNAALKIGDGDFNYIEEIDSADELEELSKTFNEMITKLSFTRHKLVERNKLIKNQANKLAESNAILENYAFIASHDLKEPLSIVQSYIQLLKRKYNGTFDNEANEYVDFALSGTKRMKTIIGDLLEYSRISKAGNGLVKEHHDFNELAKIALKNLEPIITEKQANIHIGNLPTGLGVESQIVSIFQNLIGNALKYVKDKKPEIFVTAVNNEHYDIIEFIDNGIGIPPSKKDEIFGIFKRLHTNSDYPGTGIGLAICKKIMEYHKGKIEVESKEGEGSVFRIYFPKESTLLNSARIQSIKTYNQQVELKAKSDTTKYGDFNAKLDELKF